MLSVIKFFNNRKIIMVILGLLSLIFAVIIQAGTSGNPQISLNSPVSLPVDI